MWHNVSPISLMSTFSPAPAVAGWLQGLVVGERGVSPPASCAPLVTSRCSAAAGAVVNKPSSHHCPAPVSWPVYVPWNNGKEVPRLDLTSSTMPGQQISQVQPHPDSKYNKSMWLADVSPCHAPIGRLSPLPCLITQQLHVCYISQLLRDSFSVSQQLGIWFYGHL